MTPEINDAMMHESQDNPFLFVFCLFFAITGKMLGEFHDYLDWGTVFHYGLKIMQGVCYTASAWVGIIAIYKFYKGKDTKKKE